jgi:hypothetical protein
MLLQVSESFSIRFHLQSCNDSNDGTHKAGKAGLLDNRRSVGGLKGSGGAGSWRSIGSTTTASAASNDGAGSDNDKGRGSWLTVRAGTDHDGGHGRASCSYGRGG